MRPAAHLLILAGAFALQGCAAAILPIAAAGFIGKRQIDAAKRTRMAESSVDAERMKTGKVSAKPIVTVGGAEPDVYAARPGVLPIPGNNEYGILTARTLPAPSRHPFLNFSQYALAQAQRRDQGLGVQSAVLVEKVSLAAPETVACGAKPLAVIVDLDAAPVAAQNDESLTRPLGSLLEDIRDAGLRLIWISGRAQVEVASTLDPLRQGVNPAIKAEDLISLQQKGNLRKQERRWNLAQYYCIVAIAGDEKNDFDELFGYLRNPDYAVGLGKFWNRGWFVVPHPVSVAAPEIEAPDIRDLTPELEEPE
jgi:hypothetical protein